MKCIDKEDAVETFDRGFERQFTVLISSTSIFHLPTNEAELHRSFFPTGEETLTPRR